MTLNTPFVRFWLSRRILPAWFIAMSVAQTVIPAPLEGWVGYDAHIYYRGAAAWVAGGDPWSAFNQLGNQYAHFAALPTTVLAMAPFTILPESTFVVLWIVLSTVAAVAIVRRLRLPFWWIAFPPLVNGVVVGNPDIVMLALLLSHRPQIKAVAPFLKIYALVPLIGERRWPAIVWSGGLIVGSIVIAPALWIAYMSQAGEIAVRLGHEAISWSAWGVWPLFIFAGAFVLILAAVDLRAAGWLAVPALWPATEAHYGTMAMPVATPLLGALLAVPVHVVPPLAVAAGCTAELLNRARVRRGAAPLFPAYAQARSPGVEIVGDTLVSPADIKVELSPTTTPGSPT